MTTRYSGRALFLSAMLGCAVASLPAGAADGNDGLTSLPLHPGLTFQQEVDSPICGKKAQINIYGAASTAKLEEYVAWYQGRLKGFHHVHKTWSERAQEMFYSPDGSKGVTVTGRPKADGVFSVSFMKMSVNLTTPQMDAFSPQNPACK